MSLQKKLKAKKEEFQATVPEDNQVILSGGIKDLIRAKAPEHAVREEETAPDFALKNAEGKLVRLSDQLVRGPVVLGFYRGRW